MNGGPANCRNGPAAKTEGAISTEGGAALRLPFSPTEYHRGREDGNSEQNTVHEHSGAPSDQELYAEWRKIKSTGSQGMDDDEPDYDPDPWDDYEPDPTDHPEFERYEYERYLRSLSPIGRVRYRVSSLIWRYTWRWRLKPTGPGGDEPPF